MLTWLSALDKTALAAVLARRPLVTEAPRPRRLADIAVRLHDEASMIEAIADLTAPGVQFLRAAQLCRALGREVTIPAVAELLGTTASVVEPLVATLEERALAWPLPSGALGVCVAFDPYAYGVHGLGMPMAELLDGLDARGLRTLCAQHGVPGRKELLALFRDGERMRALIAEAPADTRALLHDLAWHGPERADVLPMDPENARAEDFPAGWAVERALLFATFFTEVHMPLEVALAVRGPGYHLPFDPEPPEVTTVAVDQARIEPEAAEATLRLLARYRATIDSAAAEPLALRKTGQVGARMVNRLTKQTGGTRAEIELVLALALKAGLLEATPEGTLVPSGEAIRLQAEPDGTTLVALLSIWWEAADHPDDPESAQHEIAGARIRSRLLPLLGSFGPGRGQADAAALTARVSWLTPLVVADVVEDQIRQALADAELLGLTRAGTLTELGRAVVEAAEGTILRTNAPGLLAAAGKLTEPGPAPYAEPAREDPAELAGRLLEVPAVGPEPDFDALARALRLPEDRLGPFLAGAPIELEYGGEVILAVAPEPHGDSVEVWDVKRREYRLLRTSDIR
ncbi:hypothetical protein A4R43_14045 [Amycolatopsis albispora]|uniref:Helicase XPB/Ssl2 N-terminal domain-containing protein n=1 Tax=Amycolatopsis albispora TaxID=1804986 RepID=A0A344L653_9PSEU|nr:hypothetical protein A4R43_14045 [Amycolatopsis albispora]